MLDAARSRAHDVARLGKGVVTATAAFDLWRSARRRRVLAEWETNGRPIPPPPEVKHSLLLEYAGKYDLSLLVETGTFWGGTVAAMRPHFQEVKSIELAPRLARHSQRRFAPFKNVNITQGDSGRVLSDIVHELRTPAMFWLDGHYSGGETSETEPLRDELAAVMMAPAGSVALIDDARTFTGPPRMTLDEIRAATQQRFAMDVRDDVIRLTPRSQVGRRV